MVQYLHFRILEFPLTRGKKTELKTTKTWDFVGGTMRKSLSWKNIPPTGLVHFAWCQDDIPGIFGNLFLHQYYVCSIRIEHVELDNSTR